MATIGQIVGATATGTVSTTFSNAVAAGTTLVAAFVVKAGTIAVSDNVNGAWTVVQSRSGMAAGSTTKQYGFAYKINSAAAAANGLTVTASANSTGAQFIQVASLVPSANMALVYDLAFGNNSSGASATSLTTTSAAAPKTGAGQVVMFMGVTDTESLQTWTASNPATLALDSLSKTGGQANGTATMALTYTLSAAAGTFSAALTTSPAQNWGASLVSFYEADAQPPTTPGSFISTAQSASSASFSWASSTDNVGVTGYEITYESQA